MANKETYLEYRETFPRMVGELRDTPVEDPKYLPYAGFIFSNEQRILDMAEWLAGRKRFHDASELLGQSCSLMECLTPDKDYQAWAIKFYIVQLLSMRGKLQKKHWRKVTKLRAKYLNQVLDIADDAGLEAPVLPKLREWQGLLNDAAEKAETASEYRIAAGLFSQLGDAADLVLIGKKDKAYTHLTKTIVTLASMSNEGDAQ